MSRDKSSNSGSAKETMVIAAEMAIAGGVAGFALIPNPLVGVAAAVAAPGLGAVISSFFAKRSGDFFEQASKDIENLRQWVFDLQQQTDGLQQGVERLEEYAEALTPESLSKNQTFWSTFLHASQVAMSTDKAEKLKALRNAVLNAALPNAIEEDMQHVYLTLIGVLTVCEVKLLTLFLEPQRFGIADIKAFSSPPGTIRPKVVEKVSCLGGDESLYSFYVNDLVNRGLCDWGSRRGTVGPSGDYAELYDPNVTAIGGEFFKFIRDPFTEQNFEDEMS